MKENIDNTDLKSWSNFLSIGFDSFNNIIADCSKSFEKHCRNDFDCITKLFEPVEQRKLYNVKKVLKNKHMIDKIICNVKLDFIENITIKSDDRKEHVKVLIPFFSFVFQKSIGKRRLMQDEQTSDNFFKPVGSGVST
ncbi:hypothetical protein RFI_24355 [Reticulomyxa filosa]|uniref:Uncharacterized protein n=1 Tax=Reticulomyxa filosa TaxID=46433 RepID=X6MG72_RETFI|nr:hypothetical protein RFI_24355 [Reticulomyxa filosa]|eukprot:ETO13023.1 hypothetical protein RFI_24355 [Reticulomyxa filosa]